jgi:ABC-type lipoprotein release transport system permease subunit
MNLLKIAWRNIWRNTRRTAITVTAVALSTAILIASLGLMDGMKVDAVKNVTNLVIGDAQIHASEYRVDYSFYRTIANHEQILERAKKNNIDAVRRSYGFGLVSVGTKSAGAKFWGVEPVLEKKTFLLAGQMAQGAFLSSRLENSDKPDEFIGEIVLGRKLAKSLHAKIGSEIITVVQAADGSLGNELFKVIGILKSCGEEIDRSAAIIHQTDFRQLFVSQGRIHEIAFNSHGNKTPEQVVQIVKPQAKELELMTWGELNPSLYDMINMWSASIWIFSMIFFLAAGLGVMNTMLMATYERIREFGILKALGATPWRIIRDVSAEAFVLGLLSTFLGLIVGIAINAYMFHVGIDLSAMGGDIFIEGVAFSAQWKATFTQEGIVDPVIIMCLVCVLAALYPAIKAARLDPVRAITHV